MQNKNSINNILHERRRELNLTQKDVADAVGVSEGTVSRWESGDIVNMKRSRIAALASILRVSPGIIAGYEECNKGECKKINESSNIQNQCTIPCLGTIACGSPILAEENIEEYIDIANYVKADFCLRCKGDSMIGAHIYNGDIVCFRKQEVVENGEIAAVLIDNEATLKRFSKSNGIIMLKAENPDFADIAIKAEDAENVHIIGKATHFITLAK